MIVLESLITDDSKATIEIRNDAGIVQVRAMIEKGSMTSLPDDAYWYPQVQAAISGGYCKLVGAPPVRLASAHLPIEDQPRRRLKNITESIVTLDCIKKYAFPGECVLVPETLMNHMEVLSAMHGNMLVFVDDAGVEMAATPLGASPDEPASKLSPEEKEIVAARTKKVVAPKAKKAAPIKAKKIGAFDDVLVDTESKGGSDSSNLFTESKVHVPAAKNAPSLAAIPAEDVNLEEMEEIGVEAPASTPAKPAVNPDDLFDRWWDDKEGK